MTSDDRLLLPGWAEVFAAEPPPVPRAPLLPQCPVGLAESVRLVDDKAKAEAMAQQLRSLDLCAIAVVGEHGLDRPAVPLRSGRVWHDIRARRPVAVAFAAWANDGSAAPPVVIYVVDVRIPAVVPATGRVLALPVPFVFHDLKPAFFLFWALGLDPRIYNVYDTRLVAACLDLGRHHARVEGAWGDGDAMAAEGAARERRAFSLSLLGQCQSYGISHPSAGDEDAIRARFQAVDRGRPLPPAQVAHIAANALSTLQIYAAQQPVVVRQGLSKHLHDVEFPFAIANADMEWRGVLIDHIAAGRARQAATAAAHALAGRLCEHGLADPDSAAEVLALMDRLGVGRLFKRVTRSGQRATDDRALAAAEVLHPAIRWVRLYRRYRSLAGEEWLGGHLVGSDGRTHPQHVQLGASTGRNTCSTPNVPGIGKAFRPVVVAPVGRAVIELDFAQVEIGVAAAEHGDLALVTAVNSTDLYGTVAQSLCASSLSPEERALTPLEFKARRKDLRDRVKIICLAILYGMRPPALAAHLSQLGESVTVGEATRLRERFLDLYPSVRSGLGADGAFGLLRGHAAIRTGLRRHVPHGRSPQGWLINALRNAPIQGGAAVVLKRAVVALYEAWWGTDTWLVLTMHDALLIECAEANVAAVAAEARAAMIRALRSLYPALTPRVEVNDLDTRCWNKDGNAHSIEAFLADPLAALGLPPPMAAWLDTS